MTILREEQPSFLKKLGCYLYMFLRRPLHKY